MASSGLSTGTSNRDEVGFDEHHANIYEIDEVKGMVGVAQSISTKMVFSVFIEVSIGQTITVAKLFWDRLPACQFSHDRLEAYPTYCLGGAKADTLRAVGWSDWLVPANPNKPSDARETSALSVLKPRFTPRFPLILVVEVNRSAEEFVG